MYNFLDPLGLSFLGKILSGLESVLILEFKKVLFYQKNMNQVHSQQLICNLFNCRNKISQ